MKIQSIRAWRMPLQLTRPYTIAYKTVTDVDNVFVEITADNGLTGLGAANPSPYVVGETLADTEAVLASGMTDTLIGHPVAGYRAWGEALYTLLPQNPGARAALDIAFHDLYAQAAGLPLAVVLGQKHQQLPTSITIGIKEVAATLEEADEYVGRQFRILKVKLGHSLEEDLERLRKLRERFGFEIGIRVDANQGYTHADMIRFYAETRSLDIELVEQPLPAAALEITRSLPDEIRQTLAADESLISARDAWHISQAPPAFGILNIKLMKCGGIYQALRIAEVARLGGLELMWGCNDESIVSISAALHAAFACENTRYLDLDGSLDLAQDLVSGGFVIEEGLMRLAGGPGLGVSRL
jgi:L-alanine-DL-glutamate epimerase-like enolase superfamily enzyme